MRVAVVVPTHARPELLAQALASVLQQTVTPAEVVVVDDAGDPATAAVVDALVAPACPVRLLVARHEAGVARSRNLGAATTTAPLLAFLDDDDRWAPTFLAAATDRLDATGAGFVVGAQRHFRGTVEWDGPAMPDGLTAAAAATENPGLTGSSAVYRREVFEEAGGFDEDLWVSNDKDLLVRLLAAGVAYATVPERLVERRLDPARARLGTSGPRRVAAMERYLAKHRALLTPADARFLRARIHRVHRAAATSPLSRAAHTARMVLLLGPRGVRRLRAADRRNQP